MKNYIYTLLFLFVTQIVIAQTPSTISTPESGQSSYIVTGTEALTATQSIILGPGTHIQSGSTFTAQIIEPTTATDPYTPITFSNENYVFTRSYQKPMTSFNATTAKEGDVIEQITYFDGLGRPIQSIGIKSAPDKKDIITHIDYDGFGRQDKDWLPYYETTGSLGNYRGNKALATQQYYQTNYADDFVGITNAQDITAYSQKGFEASPLNRVLKQAAPGDDWKLGGGHEIDFDYQTNTFDPNNTTNPSNDNIRLYKTDLSFANNTYTPTLILDSGVAGYYGAGELYKTITKDENHDGTSSKAHTTEEFKDKQGRVILKRTYGTSKVNGVTQTNVAHDTYYVYDDYGNLSYVLPPKSEPQTTKPDATALSELCYQYKYDYRNRLVEKKIPGKGWEYIVYDKLDRPVLTQDTNLKLSNQWMFTKYDVFGRVVYTGLHTNTVQTTQPTMQAHVIAQNDLDTKQYETKVTSGTGYDNSYYNNNNYPSTNIVLLTINYYDNYTFDGFTNMPSNIDGQTLINYNNSSGTQKLTKGLATGSKVRVLDGSNPTNWITTITGYDVKGRPIYVKSVNDYLQTTDIVQNTLDFVGKVDKTTTTHSKTEQTDINTQDAFVYDHEGRLLRQKQTINTLDQETIVDNTYNDLGQLESKGVGGKSSNATRLQEVNYAYNVRGWLKQINNPTTLGNDLFSFKLNYNTNNHGGTNLFNGNISETVWKTANTDNSLKWYKYSYDALNRITDANYDSSNSGETNWFRLFDVAYDKNGNLIALKRHKKGSLGQSVALDYLAYTYDSGNKLLKVEELIDGASGFEDGSNGSTNDYAYDSNGNMLKDQNKGIGNPSNNGITYNHLNLPDEVKFENNNNKKIKYIYDATGVKLRKFVYNNSITPTTTDYAGNYVYEGSSLKFFNHPEGYVDASGSGYEYVYQYKDHLGNVRLSYKGSNGSLEILEENNYYPFGLKHKGYNAVVNSTNPALKYKFGGKEYQDELGLDWYDVSARNYDPALGRWMNIDLLAGAIGQIHNSTYAYAMNNPIAFN
ncbi:DUF6443 domain-containing protein, partial [Wocania ichthyoenteri]|uniref:DUF6443 domain-containing protein n=1 Tax=Wocania ichthyoenteri TaxID=1230531 RepID=UPI001FCDD77E